ncbi:MAG: DUF805 domain-containing protein [Clostridia bacterium]
MNCTNCGATIFETDKYCKVCGQNNNNYKEKVEIKQPSCESGSVEVFKISENANAQTKQVVDQKPILKQETNIKQKSEKTFGEAYRDVWLNYFNFSGVMPRQWFWHIFLLNFCIGCIPYVGQIYALFMLIGGFSACVRRLHDTGRSGFYFLIMLIPIYGLIKVIMAYCEDTNPDSKYSKKANYNNA